MASGETFEIRHPEMVRAGTTTCTIFTWMSEDNEDPKEQERDISIILIESIEPLKPANKQGQPQN
jgi:hypothetical protein